MKKVIIFSGLTMALILAPFSVSFGQELTTTQAQTLIPSLSQVVSSLTRLVNTEIVRRNAENATLTKLAPSLSLISNQLSNSNLTQAQINSLSSQVGTIQATVSNVVVRRNNFNNALSGVITTLNNIVTIVADTLRT